MSEWNDPSADGDAPYNFSLMFYIGLNKLMDAKDEAYLKNDLRAWYKTLDRIFTRISFQLKKEEQETIQALLMAARGKIIQNDNAVEDLHAIDIKLMAYMDRYKMIFPRINAKVGLKKIDARYNLKDE
jgi:hypothetical protein